MPYKVLVDDLTVNADGSAVTDLFGNVIGYQSVSSIYAAGTVLEDDQVSESLRESVDNGETEGFLEKVGDSELEESRKAGEPFPGYGEMEVEDVLTMFQYVPSDTIRAVQEYEREYGEGRAGIVDYHIGRAEPFSGRLTGVGVSSPRQDRAEKPELESIVTREVLEDDVRFGSSYQDDGTPLREPHDLAGDERTELERAEGVEPGEASEGDDSEPKGRRGRRAASKARGATSSDAKASKAKGTAGDATRENADPAGKVVDDES